MITPCRDLAGCPGDTAQLMTADQEIVTARALPNWSPAERNLSELMHRQVQARGHEPFLTFYDDLSGERTELSYATFDNWVAKTANLLREELRTGRGSRVAMTLGTHWTAIVVAFASWRVGACVVPIPVDEPGGPASLDALLAEIRPNVVVAREDLVAGVRGPTALHSPANGDRTGFAGPVVAVGGGFGGRLTMDVPNTLPYAEEVLAFADDFDDPEVTLDDAALLVVPPWSSGAVGAFPIVLDQHNLLAGALALVEWGSLSAADRLFSATPLGPVDGLVLAHLGPFLSGGASVLVRNLDASTFARKVRDERVTWAIPPGVLLDHLAEGQGDELGPLRGLLCPSGAPCPLRRQIEDTGLRVHVGHGVAAATCASTLEPVDLDDETRVWLEGLDGVPVGSPTAWAQVSERDGELCVRGPVVMAGYDGRPDLDQLAFAGGWLHTGDLGTVEQGPDGRLHAVVHNRPYTPG